MRRGDDRDAHGLHLEEHDGGAALGVSVRSGPARLHAHVRARGDPAILVVRDEAGEPHGRVEAEACDPRLDLGTKGAVSDQDELGRADRRTCACERLQREVDALLLHEACALDDHELLSRRPVGERELLEIDPDGDDTDLRLGRPDRAETTCHRRSFAEEQAPSLEESLVRVPPPGATGLRDVPAVERRHERDVESPRGCDRVPARPAEVRVHEQAAVLTRPLDDPLFVARRTVPQAAEQMPDSDDRRRHRERVHRVDRELIEVARRPREDDRPEALLVPKKGVDERRRPGEILRHDVCHVAEDHVVGGPSFRAGKRPRRCPPAWVRRLASSSMPWAARTIDTVPNSQRAAFRSSPSAQHLAVRLDGVLSWSTKAPSPRSAIVSRREPAM